MSKPSLAGREQQPSSPFGLGQKQAKNKKIRRKCATVARYSMLYRFLCNALQRDGVQPRPDLAFGLCCYVPFHHNSWYGLQKHPPPTSGMVSNYLIVLALYRGREMGRSPLDVQRQMGAYYIDNDEPLCFTFNGTLS